jgi:CRP/FNR family cyclic AMP-dependent transcriptional regulator
MIDRFRGDGGRERLVAALASQSIVSGDTAIAERLAEKAELQTFAAGTTMIEQDATDNDLFLILAGVVGIYINRRDMARRYRHEHVGEMAVLDPGLRRSATAVALEETVVAVVSERAITWIAQLDDD